MAEQVITDVSSGIGAAVAVVDADEGAEGARLDLALILEHLIGLDDRHRELTAGTPPDVAKPEQAISHKISANASSAAAENDAVGIAEAVAAALKWLPTNREEIHQTLEHPTSPAPPDPRNSKSLRTIKAQSGVGFTGCEIWGKLHHIHIHK